jgi:hypothetical protein
MNTRNTFALGQPDGTNHNTQPVYHFLHRLQQHSPNHLTPRTHPHTHPTRTPALPYLPPPSQPLRPPLAAHLEPRQRLCNAAPHKRCTLTSTPQGTNEQEPYFARRKLNVAAAQHLLVAARRLAYSHKHHLRAVSREFDLPHQRPSALTDANPNKAQMFQQGAQQAREPLLEKVLVDERVRQRADGRRGGACADLEGTVGRVVGCRRARPSAMRACSPAIKSSATCSAGGTFCRAGQPRGAATPYSHTPTSRPSAGWRKRAWRRFCTPRLQSARCCKCLCSESYTNRQAKVCKKTAVDNPLLQVPPASRGNQRARGLVPLAKRGEPTEGGNPELWQRSWYQHWRWNSRHRRLGGELPSPPSQVGERAEAREVRVCVGAV